MWFYVVLSKSNINPQTGHSNPRRISRPVLWKSIKNSFLLYENMGICYSVWKQNVQIYLWSRILA